MCRIKANVSKNAKQNFRKTQNEIAEKIKIKLPKNAKQSLANALKSAV
jgi:hypothetical protein